MNRHVVVTLLATTLFCGCNESGQHAARTPVTGVIKYKENPVEKLQVTFTIKDSPSSSFGVTNSQGEFSLSTVDTNDGAYVGENMISVRPILDEAVPVSSSSSFNPEMAKSMGESVGNKMREKKPTQMKVDVRIPAKYADPLKSNLKRTIVLGNKNHFVIDLTD